MTRAVADPAGVLKGLSEPKRAGIQKLFHSANLTVLNVVWAPRMTLLPHDHRMWAVIGIYTGREDNIFWYRVNNGHKIAAARAKALCEKDVELLGCDVIHSVTNPISRLSGAIHVYTGDFFGAVRSEWDPEKAPRTALRCGEEPAAVRGSEWRKAAFLTLKHFRISSYLVLT